jgi:hypothetical protein
MNERGIETNLMSRDDGSRTALSPSRESVAAIPRDLQWLDGHGHCLTAGHGFGIRGTILRMRY